MKSKGFSLLEVLVTMSVVVILATVGVPLFKETIQRSNADAAITSFARAFSFARVQAINLGQEVTVCHLSDANACDGNWTETLSIFIDLNGDAKVNGDDHILQQVSAIGSNDHLVTTAGTSVRFAQSGQLSSGNSTFIYCPASVTSPYAKGLVISMTGRIRHSRDTNGDGIHELDSGNLDCVI